MVLAATMLEPIKLAGSLCRDYGASSRLEWLETNGTGGYAMGTVAGTNSRRYHGLLVASLRPPVERYLLLSRLDEEIFVNGHHFALGANQFPGAIDPTGFRYLEEFRLDPFPVWRYRLNGAVVEKKLFLASNRQAVVVQHTSDTAPCLARRP